MFVAQNSLYSSFEKLTPKVTKHQEGCSCPPQQVQRITYKKESMTLKGQVSPILSFQNSNRKTKEGEGRFPSEKLVLKLW